jgi:hypothetical protein
MQRLLNPIQSDYKSEEKENKMMTEQQYKELRKKYDHYQEMRKLICASPSCVTQEESILLPPSPSHSEISAIEKYEFITNPPNKYTLYIDEDKRIATTWAGEKLGSCNFGNEYRSNMGDKRISITINAINGKHYHGTFYKSAGDYAHITAYK